MNTEKHTPARWGRNVIIADADYMEHVAFTLTVNFERMLGRHIAKADMATWAECVALDGGCPADDAEQETTVVLVHDRKTEELDCFNPGLFGDSDAATAIGGESVQATDILHGRAFKGRGGEFAFYAVASDERRETMTKADIMADLVAAMADEDGVERVIIIPDTERQPLDTLLPVLRHLDRACPQKRVTLLTMEPMASLPCRDEILGYSIMAALGIRADEINPD